MTRREKFAMHEHSSLLRKFIKYQKRSFITLVPGLPSFFRRKLRQYRCNFSSSLWSIVAVAVIYDKKVLYDWPQDILEQGNPC
jgi:hypothetical protein